MKPHPARGETYYRLIIGSLESDIHPSNSESLRLFSNIARHAEAIESGRRKKRQFRVIAFEVFGRIVIAKKRNGDFTAPRGKKKQVQLPAVVSQGKDRDRNEPLNPRAQVGL